MKPGKEAPSAATPKSISLPSLPKCDEGNRGKWMQEYDKVEAELLKSHMAGTATLGLRQLPSQWDRSIPPPILDDDRGGGGGANGAALRRPKSTLPTFSASQQSAAAGGSPERRRPRSAHRSQMATASLSTTPAPSTVDTSSLLRVLFAIIDPPVQYRSQLDLDLRHIDLHWLQSYISGDRTPTLNTLETVRDDAYTSKVGMAPINSPRSVLVLLRNGVSIDDIQVWPIDKFGGPGVAPETAAVMAQHREERRVALLSSLRDEYRELSARLSLFDLIDDITDFRHEQRRASASSPHQGGGSQKRSNSPQLEAAKFRREEHERQLQQAAEARQRAIEAKHERAAKQLEERTAAFAAAIAARHAADEEKRSKLIQQHQHQQQQQQAVASSTKAARPHLGSLSFSADGESNDANPIAGRSSPPKMSKRLPDKHNSEDHALKLLRNQHRMNKNKELVEEQRRNAELKQEQREAAASQRRAQVEAEQRTRQQQKIEARMRSDQLRAAAREKAKALELAARNEAELRAQKAAERLEAFASYKAVQAQQNSLAEQERRYQQNEAARRAEERRAAEARRLQMKHDEEAERMLALNRSREAVAQHARLQHQVEQDDKTFFVERQRKAQAYEKLLFIADLERKKAKGDSVMRARSPRAHS